MSERVCVRAPNGDIRVIVDQVPAANGITAYQDRLFMDECRPNGRMFELFADGRAPRMLADNLPLPNALSVGPDGNIYFPAIGANEIWRVPLAGGKPERFSDQVAVPTAVKFNSKGSLISTQGRTGEILSFDIQNGNRSVLATVRPGLDNLALTGDDRLFVSHFTDGGVAEILANAASGAWFLPASSSSWAWRWRVTVYSMPPTVSVWRRWRATVDAAAWACSSTGQFPGFVRGLAAAADGAVVASTSAGDVTTYHPTTHAMTENMKGLTEIHGVAVAPSGAIIIVAEAAEGDVLMVSGTEVKVAARGLARPTGVAAASDGSCYVCESNNGRVVHINGAASMVVDGLKEPQGILLLGDDLYIVDAGAREVVAFSLKSHKRETIASNLPLGAAPAWCRKSWRDSRVCYLGRCAPSPVLRRMRAARFSSPPTVTAASSRSAAHSR